MNQIAGTIAQLTVQGNLSLVRIAVQEMTLTAIVIDTPISAPHLQVGSPIQVIFKETEVIIGKGIDHRISLQNQLPGTLQALESGKLLSRVIVKTALGPIVSVITAQAVQQLQLQVGDTVTAMIKTNEVMLAP
ncbi:TOBE domain-containing protein [Lyngbya confervoides]|uniref:TOBE domain-containing protein n=1 Tax=Lyngbya confervoides BDU141951 TaxID=1574623 RepID=A0ABD4T162_9CYAN|nr:TOBE domain-containing protein [Lyngbya confervoides]MCM1982381.1 TOBE domain-containing protein [Lyngbya confervoides BDU141951]